MTNDRLIRRYPRANLSSDWMRVYDSFCAVLSSLVATQKFACSSFPLFGPPSYPSLGGKDHSQLPLLYCACVRTIRRNAGFSVVFPLHCAS